MTEPENQAQKIYAALQQGALATFNVDEAILAADYQLDNQWHRALVTQALAKLTKQGLLERVTRGVYRLPTEDKPKRDKRAAGPTAESIAQQKTTNRLARIDSMVRELLVEVHTMVQDTREAREKARRYDQISKAMGEIQ